MHQQQHIHPRSSLIPPDTPGPAGYAAKRPQLKIRQRSLVEAALQSERGRETTARLLFPEDWCDPARSTTRSRHPAGARRASSGTPSAAHLKHSSGPAASSCNTLTARGDARHAIAFRRGAQRRSLGHAIRILSSRDGRQPRSSRLRIGSAGP
jgi:hypothetical protein